MTRKYTFEEKEINGETFAIAKGRGRDTEPVRVRADWVESDDLEGKWEELIKQVVQPETIEDIDIADGRGGISRREAVEALAGAEVDGTTIVSSEEQADALVEYLAEEDIIGIEGDSLVLFRDPDSTSLDGPGLMNWAALMSAVIESIDDHIQRVEEAKEKFDETRDSLETDRSDSNERLSETAQRLKNLGDGQGVPDPNSLDEDEYQQYQRLKSHYLYLRNIEKAKEKNLFENINAGTEKMGLAIDKLKAAQEAYDELHVSLREAATQKQVFPEEAMEFVQNAGNLITDLTGVEETAEEDVDHTDLEEMIEEDVGQSVQEQASEVSDLAETAEKAAGKNLEI
ncbi:MAG: hypothetical protein ABEJ76_03485 [Halanaeroarchaeum sp.]